MNTEECFFITFMKIPSFSILGKKIIDPMKLFLHQFLSKHFAHYNTWEKIESELSPEEKKTERNFFLSSFVIGSICFVSASSASYLEYQDLDFWPQAEVSFETEEEFILAEEGFLGKTSIPTIVEEIDRSEVARVTEYRVQPGDSLDLIASKYGIRVKTLLQNNTIPNPELLKTDQVLTILPVDGYLYTIISGDTLSEISQNFSVEESVIKKQNQIEGNSLIAGKQIILPGADKPKPKAIASNTSNTRASKPPAQRTSTKTNAYTNTKPVVQYTPPRSGKSYIWPVVNRGQVTQGYRYGHYAVDIWGPNKPGIKAIASGTVTKALYHCGPRSYGCGGGGYGNMVVIDHGGGVVGLYAHNSEVYVKVGDRVNAGQIIARMGNSGNSYGATGIHLHFELQINGKKVNPLLYL